MNELTEHYDIPKPNSANNLNVDVEVLQQAFDLVDAALHALALLIGGKAAAVHGHAIAGIDGLTDALAAKMAATRTFALAELSDVIGADAALTNYVLTKIDGQYGFRAASSVLDEHFHTIAQVSGLQGALDAKAPRTNADLLGNPTVPTQAVGNNTTRIASTAFVQAAVAALVNSSPTTLDTLQELAAALGNDANFAVTTANAIAAKVAAAGGTLADGTLAGDTKLTGRVRTPNVPASAAAMDCANANQFYANVAGAVTLSMTNVPAGVFDWELEMLCTSGSVAYPASWKWNKGLMPSFGAGKTFLIVGQTKDGGATHRVGFSEYT